MRWNPDSRVVQPDDDAYPDEFQDTVDSKAPLRVAGTIIDHERRIAIVGTRSVDFEGQRLAKAIAGELARSGIAIVSGGALGVDTIAHRAALSASRRTIAFLPSALDRLTPRRNERMFRAIVESGGALITEYPPGTGVRRYHFHRRNRLIAAYSAAVLVIRSKARGGTMITARAAREIGRPLFVVPGSPEDRTSDGCNALIRKGARCVRNAGDVLEDMGWDRRSAPSPTSPQLPIVSADGQRILDALQSGAQTSDEIVRRTKLDPAQISVALLELEVSGWIRKLPGTSAYRLAE